MRYGKDLMIFKNCMKICRKFMDTKEKYIISPSHSFIFDKFSDDFINRRKDELAVYWQSIISIPQVTDFTKHHGSSELSEFLEVASTLANGASETINTGIAEQWGDQEPTKSRRNSATRSQSMSRSGGVGVNQRGMAFYFSSINNLNRYMYVYICMHAYIHTYIAVHRSTPDPELICNYGSSSLQTDVI